MRIFGEWVVETDGEVRPLISILIRPYRGNPHRSRFLVDIGADRTVLCRLTLDTLDIPITPAGPTSLAGIGGRTPHVDVHASLVFTNDAGVEVSVSGMFAALLDPAASDSDILGRDVLNIFDVIVSRPRNEVILLHPPHAYQITPP